MKEKYEPHAMGYEAVIISNAIREKASELDDILEQLPACREKS